MTNEEQLKMMTPPEGLTGRGLRFWERITAAVDLTEDSAELLQEVCETITIIDALKTAAVEQPVTVKGSRGQVRINPVFQELRMQRLALATMLKQLGVPAVEDDNENEETTGRQRTARHAARARWGRR
jgi:hypothetical protein